MNFFTPSYLDSILMWAPENLGKLADLLIFKKTEFNSNCKNKKCAEADEILTYNITQLMETDDIRTALIKLADKFPELEIDLSDTTVVRKKILKLGKYADKMLEEAQKRGIN